MCVCVCVCVCVYPISFFQIIASGYVVRSRFALTHDLFQIAPHNSH